MKRASRVFAETCNVWLEDSKIEENHRYREEEPWSHSLKCWYKPIEYEKKEKKIFHKFKRCT